ncbi:UNVERIFIED_CONTAM: hypothetical protein FKN15_037154 [Acipenser sinensis]
MLRGEEEYEDIRKQVCCTLHNLAVRKGFLDIEEMLRGEEEYEDIRKQASGTTAPGTEARASGQATRSAAAVGVGFSGSHLEYWRHCTTDIRVLTTIESGYSLQFKHGPPPFRGVTAASVMDPQGPPEVSQEVAKMGYSYGTPCPVGGLVLFHAQAGWWPQTNPRPQSGQPVLS